MSIISGSIESGLVIHQTFSPKQVGPHRADSSHIHTYCAVADTTIMLALMAGRNVKETMGMVNAGKVSIAGHHSSHKINATLLPVADHFMGTVCVLRTAN